MESVQFFQPDHCGELRSEGESQTGKSGQAAEDKFGLWDKRAEDF